MCPRIFLAAIFFFSTRALADPAENLRVARLAQTGKLWNTVKYFHPYLAERVMDWDGALVKAIPKVGGATTRDEFAAGIEEMLGVLADEATYLNCQPPVSRPAAAKNNQALVSRWQERVLVIQPNPATNWLEYRDLQEALSKLNPEIVNAQAVLFDLREEADVDLTRLKSLVPKKTTSPPAQRFIVHHGYRHQTLGSLVGYHSAFEVDFVEPLHATTGIDAKRVAFLVHPNSSFPASVLAFQAAGNGYLVVEGHLSGRATVEHMDVDLGEGLTAVVRTSEWVFSSKGQQLHADLEVTDGKDALAAALRLLKNPPHRHQKASVTSKTNATAPGTWRPDDAYPAMTYPPVEYRLLAGFRMWAIARWFYPYRPLIEENWDDVLVSFIPKLEAARNSREYVFTLAEMSTHFHDGHVNLSGNPELGGLRPYAIPPLRIRKVEGDYAVDALFDSSATADIHLGDLVVAIDGQSSESRARELSRYLSASTDAGLTAKIEGAILGGNEGPVTLDLKDAGGQIHRHLLTRKKEYVPLLSRPRVGDAVKLLENGIGYVDLRLLSLAEVDGMFERLRTAPAIIFDMRGYPRGTFRALGKGLNTRKATAASLISVPMVTAKQPEGQMTYVQTLESSEPKYTGPTVMLIDEWAISQSEHTGLFLEAANGTTFVGSRTAGANGGLTAFTVPGGITITFTGNNVRHADGRQLQRVGLIPDVEVKPTLNGIRSGQDEVLDAALKYLKTRMPRR